MNLFLVVRNQWLFELCPALAPLKKGRAKRLVGGERPIGAASCSQQSIQASCQPPSPPIQLFSEAQVPPRDFTWLVDASASVVQPSHFTILAQESSAVSSPCTCCHYLLSRTFTFSLLALKH